MPILLFGYFDEDTNGDNMTTLDLIRDRAIDLVEALTPTYVPGSKFRRYRNEGDGDFLKWAENNPADAFRRFQIVDEDDPNPPAVSNSDHEERVGKLTVMVAYPHDARTGAKQALDRRTAMSRDHDAIYNAIGLYSRQNFSSPNPDACFLGWQCVRTKLTACDYLVIEVRYRFVRAVLA